MPRSSDGSYSLPAGTLVNTGDTILVSQHNPFAQDIEQALTGSLDRGGSGGMLSDLNMNSHKLTNLAPGTNPNDAVTVAQLVGPSGGGMPIGGIIDFAGSAAPSGWMFCDGRSLSRVSYPDLFTAIGTTYGGGSGSTFNLPDLRGRVTAGRDIDRGGLSGRLASPYVSPDGATLGADGGVQAITLTESQIPSHTHPVSGTASSAGDHTHNYTTGRVSTLQRGEHESYAIMNGSQVLATSTAGAHTHTLSATATATGGGAAHPNVQPTLIMNKIIKVSN